MSFAAPLFLLGLFALAVPWLLHRLNQHEAPVQDFPSSLFLQATTAVSARKKNLRYLRLLALRLLLIALLCLLFAEPAIKRVSALLGSEDKLNVIVLDTSFSMQQAGNWEAAGQAVDTILGSLATASPMQLMSAGGSLQALTAVTLEKQQIEAAMVGLAPGFERLQYGELMQQLSAHALESELPLKVHFVSDMQASAMPVRVGELINRDFETLELHDVNPASTGKASRLNHAVRANVKQRDQDTFDMLVEVSRFGAELDGAALSSAAAEQELVLYKAGEAVATRPLAAGTNDTLVFAFESLAWPVGFDTEQYEARLSPGDELTADDSALIAVQREAEVPIAIVSNRSRQVQGQSVDELYLKTALKLDPRNRVTTHSTESLNLPAEIKLVIYLDYLALQDNSLPGIPDQLQRLRDEGKHVLYVLNAESQRLDNPSEVVSAAAGHPLGLNLGAWEDVRFFAHQLIQHDDSQVVLLEAGAGYPVLIEQQVDNTGKSGARMLWLNAALNAADNSLPVSPVFVPFLSDVVDYFVRADSYPAQLTVGDGLRLKRSLQMLDPEGNSMLGLADRGKQSTQIVSRPGIYTLLDSNAEFPIKVVVDIAESDVRRADTSETDRWINGRGEADTKADSQGESSRTDLPGSLAGDLSGDLSGDRAVYSLWHALLPLCLLLLLLETLYANWHLRTRRTT